MNGAAVYLLHRVLTEFDAASSQIRKSDARFSSL